MRNPLGIPAPIPQWRGRPVPRWQPQAWSGVREARARRQCHRGPAVRRSSPKGRRLSSKQAPSAPAPGFSGAAPRQCARGRFRLSPRQTAPRAASRPPAPATWRSPAAARPRCPLCFPQDGMPSFGFFPSKIADIRAISNAKRALPALCADIGFYCSIFLPGLLQ